MRAGAVAVGVGVLFGGAAVGGPAGVADAEGAVERDARAGRLRGCASLPGARRSSSVALVGAADGDAGRVVAAVFEAAQALDDDGNDFLWADVTDDSAHVAILCEMSARGSSPKVEAGLCFCAGGMRRENGPGRFQTLRRKADPPPLVCLLRYFGMERLKIAVAYDLGLAM